MSPNKFITAACFAVALFGASGALAQAASSSPALVANEINYVSQLPTPSELSKAQPPAGATLAKIKLTPAEVSATYVYSNGQTQVVVYRLLAAASGPTASAQAPTPPTAVLQSPAVVQPSTPPPVYYYDAPPTVVYQVAPAPVYYDQPVYYSSYYPWYPAVSLGLNFGFHGGYGFRGGFRGGFRH
jgi:hypothetical protein